ncbi:cubilin homolog [Drosophila tropicalis]|uniref:cubilin homolog n=1 Tax=Drosophila tropicalis TaxID=46794 RepID=UPI0035AB8E6B
MFNTADLRELCLCLFIFLIHSSIYVHGAKENYENRGQIIGQHNGNLLLETASDRNITVRLMGDAATILVNDVDMMEIFRRRQRAIAAHKANELREPLSLEPIKGQFRITNRNLVKLGRRLNRLSNGTKRNGVSQRLLRKQKQRIQRIEDSIQNVQKNLVKDECKSNPCKNGGICYDAYEAFQCECPAGWQGPTCEDDVNECFDLAGTDLAACQNNAQCINTPGSYRCVCRNGFTGTHCRLRHNACLAGQSKELCGDHGTCIHSNANADGFVCICDQGWTWANTNATVPNSNPCTKDVDECRPDINPCHRDCINLPGSYRCGPCPPGYTGDGKYCRDINECAPGEGSGEENGGCSLQPRVACINTEGSYRCGRCPPGWNGDGRTCKAADSNTCNGEQICHPQATCEMISQTMVCSCREGFFGHGYGPNGCNEDSDRQPCHEHLCQNNGTCVVNGGRGTSCICQPGYTGALCNQSDACHPNPCRNKGTCRLILPNDFTCNCPVGYTDKKCSSLRFYCGSTVRAARGTLRFPPNNEESTYQPDERCPFIIRTTPGSVLNVTFNQFDLQNSTNCKSDFLQLHDGSSLAARRIGTYCGSTLPEGNGTIIATHGQIFFWFLSDNRTEGRGFNLTWSSQPLSCGGEITIPTITQNQSGIIRSPGYPGKAPPRADCRWLITAPFGTRLILRFFDITLGGNRNTNCSQDSLIIHDEDRQIFVACDSIQPSPLHSSSNKLRLDFHTDAHFADSSFQLHYEAVPGVPGCGGIYTEPTGRISSLRNSEICLYLIEQPSGTQIQLNFLQMDLPSISMCQLQKVEIFDGRTDSDPLLKRFCEKPSASELEPIISAGEVVLIRVENNLAGLLRNRGFELTYTRVCNYNIRDSNPGIIQTPNYPGAYFSGLTCTFLIQGPIQKAIKLKITDLSFSVTDSVTSENNYLDIYLSRDEKRRYNKTMGNTIVVTKLNEARVIFHGSGAGPDIGRGFRIEYSFTATICGGIVTQPIEHKLQFTNDLFCQWIIEIPGRKLVQMSSSTICGGTYTHRYGIIKSPNWPRPYGSEEECIWLIRAPLGHRIELIVNNFTLEGVLDECLTDYLEVRNGDMILSPLIGRYCGTNIPSRIPSFGNALYVQFKSDDSVEMDGFHINWQFVESGCGGKLYTPEGSIHSPHSGLETSGAVACDWQIVVAQGSRITMRLQSFDQDLCRGQLIIYDGPTTQNRPMRLNCTRDFLKPNIDITLRSSTNRVLVRYDVSNDEPDGISFTLDYVTNCKVQLEQMYGAVETPNFPENYPDDSDCEWDLRAGDGNNHIQLAFSHLMLDCVFDFIMLQDMQNDQVLGQRRLCNRDKQDGPITSEGNRFLLSFTSDVSDNNQGFHAEYKRVGCGEKLQGYGGHLESPNAPYSVDLDCIWQISVPEGKRIRLVINELHIETNEQDCSQDALTVAVPMINGGNNYSSTSVLLRSCQIETSTQTFKSPGNELNVHFRSSKTRARKYFKASYVQLPASCGGLSSSSNGLITSPGFHDQEDGDPIKVNAADLECDWQIQVPNSYGISLQFEYFNLTDSPNCSAAFIELSKLDADDSEHFLERACGDEKLLIRLVHGNKLRVRFIVKANNFGRFALRYERQCGGPLPSTEGYIKSRLDENCRWLLSSPEGSKLSLTILQLECPACSVGNNCTNGLTILDDDDEVMLNSFCNTHPVDLIVRANNVAILAKGINFSGRYTNIANTCGGEILSARGTLTSPNYPDSYPENVECVWSIAARAGNTIELTFSQLDIAKSEHCNEDFLEIRAGLQGRILGLYCDNNMPDSPIYVNSSVWIKFRSLPKNSAKGFMLRWNYVHENEITEQTNGTIESPPTLSVIGDFQPYSWRIFVKRNMLIILQFVEYNFGLMLYDGYDTTALGVNINSSPWQFTSSSNVLYLRTTNAAFSSFRLTWHTVSTEEVENNRTVSNNLCHEKLTVNSLASVMVSSPGYPNGYKPNMNCEWIYKAKNNWEHVYVDILKARLEDISDCEADYLQIQSSSNLNDWNTELRVCNKSDKSPIQRVHGTPNLRLQFVSDASINGTGFLARVGTRCGSNMTGPVGTIASSMFSTDCDWHIEVNAGRKIDITIQYDKINMNNITCPSYGLIYDGLDNAAPLMVNGKFCNRHDFATENYRTSGSHVFIKYVIGKTLVQVPFSNWTLTYREFNECNGEIQLTELANTYNISTPGYPYYPHPHADCTWLVIGPPGETISATFVDRFDLSIRQCEEEFVELYDGSTQMANRLLKSCTRPKTTLRSTSNLLLIHYQTNLIEPRSGFRLNVSLSKCGGVYTRYSDSITSENYPALGAYPKNTVCTYTIKLPIRMSIQLNITDLHLPLNIQEQDPTKIDSIEIIDLMDMDKVLNVLYGNTTTPLLIPLYTNEVAIRFRSVKNVNNYRGFKLTYQRVFEYCSREVNAPSGNLNIPIQQVSFGNRACRWRITVPKGQRVRLELTNLGDIQQLRQNVTSIRTPIGLDIYNRFPQPIFSFYNDEWQRSDITKFNLIGYNGSGIIESTDNYMLAVILVYKLNLATTTLKAKYSSEQATQCPPDIGDRASGVVSIESLNGLTNYFCVINFVGSTDETIVFKIEEYQFKTRRGFMALTFRDNNNGMFTKKLTANVTNSFVSLATISGAVLLLQNSDTQLQRFRASYRRHKCGGVIRMEESMILDFPPENGLDDDDYGEVECTWLLTNSMGYELFGNISLSDRCDREYLVIFSGMLEVARLCRGMAELNTTLLQKSSSRVIYHSSQYRSGGGRPGPRTQFTLQARRTTASKMVYVGQRSSPMIEINSTKYKNNMELSWDYQTSEGVFLVVEFHGRFFIESSPNCTHDQLQVLGYINGLWQMEKTFCGRELPANVVINSSKIRVVFRTNANITGDGFAFTVKNTCSTMLKATDQLQTLTSPRWLASRDHKLNCSYEIYTDTQKQLVINVKSRGQDGWSSNMCKSSYFQAFKMPEIPSDGTANAADDGEQLIDRFCPNFEVTGYRKLRLNYISTMVRRFELQYQLWGCGGNFTQPFELRSPRGETTGSYANNLNCVWRITAPATQAIFIDFKYLDMEKSRECHFDELSIYKGSLATVEQRVARLCGTMNTPPTIMVNSNQATIVVRTDASNSGRGFMANVRFTKNCNEDLALSEGNDRLNVMRQYQINKSEDLICYFRASVPPKYRIAVELKTLNLNNQTYLEVIDSKPEITSLAKYSNITGIRPKFFSSYEDLSVLLKSGNQSKSSNISFELILQMERTMCGENDIQLNSKTNFTIRLPKMDGNISSIQETVGGGGIHCTWNIKSTDEVEVRIRWLRVREVSQITGKCVDYLQVSGSFPTKYYCGQLNDTYEVIEKYASDNFKLTFHTDDLDKDSGVEFEVSERVACNRTYTELSGYITYNREYAIFNCTDYIRVPDSYTLMLRILDVQFVWDYSAKYFNVTDLKAKHTLLNITSSEYTAINKFTTTNELLLEMTSISNMQMFYYATNKNLPSGCGGYITSIRGTLVNPPYDNRNHSVCTWILAPSAIVDLTFSFLEFDMGSETNCPLDNIKFYEISADGSEKLRQTLCGQGYPESFVITSNHVKIVAKKSPNFDGTGFQIEYLPKNYYDY